MTTAHPHGGRMTTAPTLSDRRRVELAIPARLLFGITGNCIGASVDKGKPETEADRQVMTWLEEACTEPLTGLPPEHKEKVARRIERAYRHVVQPWLDSNKNTASVFLTVLYWLQGMLDEGRLELIAGSAADKAITVILATLEDHADLWAEVEKSARKQAPKLTQSLQVMGYYTDAQKVAA
jgi:hypothetical protein